jgi:hypothetical protein
MVKCEICGKEFKSDRSLHAHLKAHKITVVEYYQQFFPRFDLYSGDPIEYKSKEQYFEVAFNSPLNFRKWREEAPTYTVRKFCLEMIRKRIKKKNMQYSMCQVELRSLKYPAINELNRIFGDYYDTCSELGLENKYKKTFLFKDNQQKDDLVIYVDTREKNPLKFNTKTELKGLKFGDYALSTEDDRYTCRIERKSLADFVGTLRPDNYERFRREIEKAQEANALLVILIEQDFKHALSFGYLRKKHSKERIFKNTKVTSQYILRRVRDLIYEYPLIQFLFVDGRREASRVVEKIFSNEKTVRHVDLQLAYDSKKL